MLLQGAGRDVFDGADVAAGFVMLIGDGSRAGVDGAHGVVWVQHPESHIEFPARSHSQVTNARSSPCTAALQP